MKRFAGVIAVAVLLAVGWTSYVHGAPKEGKGLMGRIADTLLGDRNVPGVLVPILENEDATAALMQQLSSALDYQLVNLNYDKRIFGWAAREIDKDARAVRFEDRNVVTFDMETEATVTSTSFFHLYRDDLKLTDDDQMVQLRAEDEVVETSTGNETYTLSRFRQEYKNIPVLGAQYTTREKDGRLLTGSGALAEGIDIDVTPSVSVESALTTALSDINAEAYSWSSNTCTGASDCIPSTNPSFMGWFCVENVTGDCMPIEDNPSYPWACAGDFSPPMGDIVEPFPGYCSEPEGTLVIVSEKMAMEPGTYHLAWGFRVYTATPSGAYDVLVDAHSGELLAKTSPMLGGLPSELSGFSLTEGPCNGQTEFNGVQDFTATHVATDSSFPMDLYILYLEERDSPNKRPRIEVHDGGGVLLPNNMDYYATMLDEGYCSFGVEHTLASSVWWALMETYGFYGSRGWNGLDGKGEDPILALIDYSLFSGSHYFSTGISSGMMVFSKYSENPPVWAVGLTDVAHEYTHGIVETVAPTYFGIKSYEYTGLQEGIAMAMEQFINSQVTGQPITAPFYNDPKSVGYPDTYKGEYWPTPVVANLIEGPLCDSTHDWCYKYGSIFVQWLRLMFDGGSGVNDNGYEYYIDGVGNNGVVWDQVIKILLRAIRDGLKPADGFYELREHMIEAVNYVVADATDPMLDRVKEMKQRIRNAWAAVGVGAAAEDGFHSPKNGDPDVKPWPVTFTWEASKESEQVLLVSKTIGFTSSFAVGDMSDTPLLNEPGSGIGDRRVLRKAKLNLRADRSYYWKVVTLTPEESMIGMKPAGMGFTIIPWLKDILGMSSTTPPPSDATYGPTPSYVNAVISPVRYFKTSKMKPVLVAPTGVGKVHPWQTSFVMGDISGAEWVSVIITDSETNLSEHIVKDADEAFNDADNTYVVKRDLKVDHHYTWSAIAQGPDVHDGEPLPIQVGKSSEVHDFWTSRPKVALESPTTGMEVQPEAFFKWSELPGIDEALGNGAHYRLVVSEHEDVSNPDLDRVVDISDLLVGEKVVNLPPTDSSGAPADYYWSVLPYGPSEYGEQGEFAQPVYFVVDASATRPVGVSPDYGIKYGKEVKFRWMPVPDASAYEVRVFHPNGTLVWNHTVTEADWMLWADGALGLRVSNINNILSDLEMYKWDVRGIFAGNPGLASDQLKIHIMAPSPVLIWPKDGYTHHKTVSEPLLFAWDADFAPNGYELSLYTGDACSAGQKIREVNIPTQNTRSYSDFAGSDTEGNFAWTIAVVRPSGQYASWSNCAKFKLEVEEDGSDPEDVETCTAPPTPTITAPEYIPFDTHLFMGTRVEWDPSPGADQYRVKITKTLEGPAEDKCQYLTNETYTMPVNNCVHELVGQYQIYIYAESDSCHKVGDPATFIYYTQ